MFKEPIGETFISYQLYVSTTQFHLLLQALGDHGPHRQQIAIAMPFSGTKLNDIFSNLLASFQPRDASHFITCIMVPSGCALDHIYAYIMTVFKYFMYLSIFLCFCVCEYAIICVCRVLHFCIGTEPKQIALSFSQILVSSITLCLFL